MFLAGKGIVPERPYAVCLIMLFWVLLPIVSGCARPGAAAPSDISATPPESTIGTLLDPPKQLADFTLTSHTGKPLRLSDLQGRPVLLFFGYTHCPDVCPLTLSEWKKVKQALGDAANDVEFVFVSVDGARDTPDVLARFVGAYDPAFTGLTGDKATVQTIAKDFGVYFNDHNNEVGAKGMVEHSPSSFLINQEGQLRVVYSYGVPSEVISADLRHVLTEG